ECFPLNLEAIPPLAAYNLRLLDSAASWTQTQGIELAQSFSRQLPGDWVYAAGRILTNDPAEPETIDTILEKNRSNSAQVAAVAELVPLVDWQPDAISAAEYVLQTSIQAHISEIRETLLSLGTRIRNGYVLREPRLRAWEVAGYPAISISIRSNLLYDRNLQQYIEEHSPEDSVGLRVMDRTPVAQVATVEKVLGTVAQQREALLQEDHQGIMQHLLQHAADHESVVQVSGGQITHLPASALRVVIRTQSREDWERFGVDGTQAVHVLRLAPAVRAKIVRTASDILKNAGIIENAYNSRTHPERFVQMDFTPSLTFAEGRVRPYQAETLAADFLQNGLYARHPRFKSAPITLAMINTLDNIASDFMEAMRRQIERDFDFEIEMIRERTVRVVSEKNIASAVRVVEKENPHAVLAFFPDSQTERDPNDEYLKSLTLGKGIASQSIYESTMHNPDAMALVIMGVLAKTGNAPFSLTEPLDFAQLVVGLDVVREHLTRGDRLVVMTRIYRRDGLFMQYFMDHTEIEPGAPVPFSTLQRVFPIMFFKGKTVVVHHDGELPADIRQMLHQVADGLGASFHPVEILRQHVPRLYGLAKQIEQAPWGSTFLLGATEAFTVTSAPTADRTAQPLHIRIERGTLTIEQAVYSVLAWTLLHYGSQEQLALPVTIQHAADLAEWLKRGMLPQHQQGDIPFWL
ncbi:MAG: hypothetical protein KC496_01610, partial [Anaerolineae bacterium]|nr:hypothetical protein [Anaerolineae bacterium]